MQVTPYVLRADGRLHAADIRGVATTSDGRLLSASRDNTAQVSVLPPPHAPHDDNNNDDDDDDTLVTQFTFVGHTAFVNFVLYCRALALLGGRACCVTGSNDAHVAVWDAASGQLAAVLDGHAQGVCAGVQLLLQQQQPSLQQMTQHDDSTADVWAGDVVTGDWAGVCIVFDGATGRVKRRYTQHTTAIRGVAQVQHGSPLVVSSSGDKTAHVWHAVSGATLRVCLGHADVVQCVAALDGVVATGSNDCTLRVWDMRDACDNNNNDNNNNDDNEEALRKEVMVTQSAVLHGHASLIYAVAWHARTRELLSASEDHTVMVWRCGHAAGAANTHTDMSTTTTTAATAFVVTSSASWAAVQQLHHPCVVWSVAVRYTHYTDHNNNNNDDDDDDNVEGDDLVTGSADGVLRVWTRHHATCAASAAKRDALARAVASRRVDVKEVADAGATAAVTTSATPIAAATTTASAAAASATGLDVATMPCVDDIHHRRGRHEGERLFARNDAGEVELYNWSSGRWAKVGVVVAGPQHTPYTGSGSGGAAAAAAAQKQLLDGVAYDYVFDVDVHGTMLRLPYNRGDSIPDAAQRFIDDHAGVVYQDSKEQITNFLLAQLTPEDVALATQPRRDTVEGDKNNNNNNDHNSGTTSSAAAAARDATTPLHAQPTPTVFTSLNAAGAQRKLDELLARQHNVNSNNNDKDDDDDDDDDAASCVMQRLAEARSDDALVAVCATLSRLHTRLPHAETWVLLDALRYLLVHPLHNSSDNNRGAAAAVANTAASPSPRVLSCVLHTAATLLQLTPPSHHHHHHDNDDEQQPRAHAASSTAAGVLAQLRFAANVVAALLLASDRPTRHDDDDDSHVAFASSLFAHTATSSSSSSSTSMPPREAALRLLLWAVEFVRAHARRVEGAARVACVAVLRNVCLLLHRHASALQAACADDVAAVDSSSSDNSSTTAAAAATTDASSLPRRIVDDVVVAVAQLLLSERSGSALTPQLLSTAIALYEAVGLLPAQPSSSSAQRNNNSNNNTAQLTAWHRALRTQAHTLLYFTLQAIVTGADEHCHAPATALLAACV